MVHRSKAIVSTKRVSPSSTKEGSKGIQQKKTWQKSPNFVDMMVLKQSGFIDAVQFKFTNKRKTETCSFDTNKEQIVELTSMQASAVEG